MSEDRPTCRVDANGRVIAPDGRHARPGEVFAPSDYYPMKEAGFLDALVSQRLKQQSLDLFTGAGLRGHYENVSQPSSASPPRNALQRQCDESMRRYLKGW